MIQKRIRKRAVEKATDLFNTHRRDGTLRRTAEEIQQLAQSEAAQFYRSGKILLFPVSLVQSQETTSSAYVQAFVSIYTKFKNHYLSRHSA